MWQFNTFLVNNSAGGACDKPCPHPSPLPMGEGGAWHCRAGRVILIAQLGAIMNNWVMRAAVGLWIAAGLAQAAESQRMAFPGASRGRP